MIGLRWYNEAQLLSLGMEAVFLLTASAQSTPCKSCTCDEWAKKFAKQGGTATEDIPSLQKGRVFLCPEFGEKGGGAMLGLADPQILLVFVLCILSAAACLVYGLINWNSNN